MSEFGKGSRALLIKLAHESNDPAELRRLIALAVDAWERNESLYERAEAAVNMFLSATRTQKEEPCQTS